ncbi:hypothetical protein GPUN_1964 [Glaciecola punicea ACAM 611]|jgi:sulfur carrier protein|uniref:Sulfur carrier protein n=1 Tax=Glaciecola punicea ACAM 611 TaxID=1121923 RepID=H5TCQ2_9ALTE|nr:sulfur carrier protein ThiS [Glaciecola punicea]OFA31994.1 thiamine biosynthesis protein ThiS [Glaciecola punicea]GAB56079.1 hypothetical protein GPUN_1964 [Glaciecola punicea ACAM 611]
MITIFINGEAIKVQQSHSLRQILEANSKEQQWNLGSVAAACNQHIVPKSEWSQLTCQENDHIELYHAVAGG